jgi:6-pyruvoyltetrahydropterin/6-carboxytetrahydropterin synthase
MPDPQTGMIIDFGLFAHALEGVRDGLDHRFLDEVPDLGPATMENHAAWIWSKLTSNCSGLARVSVYRDSNAGSCTYFGPGGDAA